MDVCARRLDLLRALVEEGVLSPELASSAEARALDEWIPLGRVLREAGKLKLSQVMDLIEEQAREPHLRLGELAVRKQLCTQADVDAALAEQRARSPHPLEILLDEQNLDSKRLCRALVRYVERLTAS